MIRKFYVQERFKGISEAFHGSLRKLSRGLRKAKAATRSKGCKGIKEVHKRQGSFGGKLTRRVLVEFSGSEEVWQNEFEVGFFSY